MNQDQFRQLEKNIHDARQRKANRANRATGLPDAEQRQQPAALARGDEGEALRPGFALVRFTLHRVNRLDVDAKYGSVKDLLDGLRFACLIRGDTEDDIALEVIQVKEKHYKNERVVIEIFQNANHPKHS